MNFFKLKHYEVIMVGDSYIDIQAGKSAGVKTVGATYGFGKSEIKNYKPDYIIREISEILSIV